MFWISAVTGKFLTISMAPINEEKTINAGLNKSINKPLPMIPPAISNTHCHWPICQPNILHKLRKIYPPAIKPLKATANFCKNNAKTKPNNPKAKAITRVCHSVWPQNMFADNKTPYKKPRLATNSQNIFLPAKINIAPNTKFINFPQPRPAPLAISLM